VRRFCRGVEFFRQRPNFLADLAEKFCQELATLVFRCILLKSIFEIYEKIVKNFFYTYIDHDHKSHDLRGRGRLTY
jgi:hypothetical protein